MTDDTEIQSTDKADWRRKCFFTHTTVCVSDRKLEPVLVWFTKKTT